ncbi:MAG: diguanylate cyclase (GGDEF)-like protein [Paracoccaceae bacterium]|jgi:diguanylate cyclase (GGDEF)-like protein
MDKLAAMKSPGIQTSQLDGAKISQFTVRRRAELLRLRFVPADEARFRSSNDASRQHMRALYMLAGIILIAGMLVFDYLALVLPSDFLIMRSQTGLLVMVPVLTFAFLVNQSAIGKRYSEPAEIFAVVVCSLCMLYQRQSGFNWGIDLPATFIALPLFVGLLLCRLRWLPILPLQVALYSLTVASEFSLPHSREYQLAQVYSFTLLMTAIFGGAWVVELFNRITWLRQEWLREISSRDALTGLLNKREFNRELVRLFKLAAREKRPLTILMVDVDHFKAYNDHYGHQSGDHCLTKITDALRTRSRRGGDLAGRVGGEEFAVAWYGNDRVTATLMLEQLLNGVRDLGIEHEYTGTVRQRVTISVGARWLVPDAYSDPATLIHEADMLLYESKQSGRDCFRLE